MPYTLRVKDREEEKKVVMSLMGRERDMYDHEQTLARFNKMLEDKDFVGSEMEDSKGRKVSFRQKIEKEIPVLEGRIAECKALIKSMEDMGKIPSQARIDEIIDELSQSNAQ